MALLTPDEEEHARQVLARWPAEAVRSLQALPRREQLLAVLCAALLDAEPVDPASGRTLAELADRRREWEQHIAEQRHPPSTPPPAEWLELGARLGARPRPPST